MAGFHIEPSQRLEKNFGAIRGARPVVVAAKKKRKILGSKFENQIPNPRGKPFNLESLIEFGTRCLCVCFHVIMAKKLEPQLEGRPAVGEGKS